MLLPAVEKYTGLVFGALSKAVCGSEIAVTNPKVDYGFGGISVFAAYARERWVADSGGRAEYGAL